MPGIKNLEQLLSIYTRQDEIIVLNSLTGKPNGDSLQNVRDIFPHGSSKSAPTTGWKGLQSKGLLEVIPALDSGRTFYLTPKGTWLGHNQIPEEIQDVINMYPATTSRQKFLRILEAVECGYTSPRSIMDITGYKINAVINGLKLLSQEEILDWDQANALNSSVTIAEGKDKLVHNTVVKIRHAAKIFNLENELYKEFENSSLEIEPFDSLESAINYLTSDRMLGIFRVFYEQRLPYGKLKTKIINSGGSTRTVFSYVYEAMKKGVMDIKKGKVGFTKFGRKIQPIIREMLNQTLLDNTGQQKRFTYILSQVLPSYGFVLVDGNKGRLPFGLKRYKSSTVKLRQKGLLSRAHDNSPLNYTENGLEEALTCNNLIVTCCESLNFEFPITKKPKRDRVYSRELLNDFRKEKRDLYALLNGKYELIIFKQLIKGPINSEDVRSNIFDQGYHEANYYRALSLLERFGFLERGPLRTSGSGIKLSKLGKSYVKYHQWLDILEFFKGFSASRRVAILDTALLLAMEIFNVEEIARSSGRRREIILRHLEYIGCEEITKKNNIYLSPEGSRRCDRVYRSMAFLMEETRIGIPLKFDEKSAQESIVFGMLASQAFESKLMELYEDELGLRNVRGNEYVNNYQMGQIKIIKTIDPTLKFEIASTLTAGTDYNAFEVAAMTRITPTEYSIAFKLYKVKK